MDDLLAFICGPERRLILKGAGGTGKTTMINELIDKINTPKECASFHAIEFIDKINTSMKSIVCAPTHNAVNVLTKAGVKNTSTLQSFLYLVMKYDEDGNRIFVPTSRTGKHNYNLVVIDECSMINSSLFDIIEKYITCKVIYVGDSKQLPPVGEEISKVFAAGFTTIELTEQKRTTIHNEIYSRFRTAVDLQEFPMVNDEYIMSKSDMEEIIARFIKDDSIKLIAHSNRKVDEYNRFIIKSLFGDDEYYPNMRLLFKDFYTINFVPFNTNTEVIIKSVEKKDIFHPYGIKYMVYEMLIYRAEDKYKDEKNIRLFKIKQVCKQKNTNAQDILNKFQIKKREENYGNNIMSMQGYLIHQ